MVFIQPESEKGESRLSLASVDSSTIKKSIENSPSQDPFVPQDPQTPKSIVGFKKRKSLAARRQEAATIRAKFPHKVPLVVERYHRESSLPVLDKEKFMVPRETTMSQFIKVLRTRLNLAHNQALFVTVGNRHAVSLSLTMAEISRDFVETDGFVYIVYSSQESFG